MSDASSAGASPAPLSGPTLILAAMCLAFTNFMVILDTTIANVSVPHIAGELAVSPAQGTWVITSYAVAEAITVPLTGWLASRFGVVRVFVTCLVGFGFCSMLCGMAPTFGLLVLFRVMQGLCGGPMMPMSQTLLMSIFPREKAAQALGIWSMTIVVAPICGPLLGGYISDNLHWSWIFLINVPVAAGISLLAIRLFSSRETPTRRVPVDYVGLGLLIVFVGSLQIMLDKGKELDWFGSPVIVGLAITAVVGFVAFLIWELTSENPIVNLRVFRHRGFVVGVWTLSLAFGSFFSMVVLLPLWLQTNMGYTATWAGYASCLNGFSAVVMSPIVARLVGKVDLRALVAFGVLWISMVAFWRSGFTTEATFWQIALPQLVLGVGIPFVFIPTTTLSLSSVPPEETAAAAGMQNFLRTTAAAFATSIMTTGWENTANVKRAELAGALNDPQGVQNSLTAQGFTPDQALSQIEGIVQTQAVMLSTNQMFLTVSLVLIVAALLIWVAPSVKRNGAPAGGGH
jgi:DHA2 family multidrug resistance protein